MSCVEDILNTFDNFLKNKSLLIFQIFDDLYCKHHTKILVFQNASNLLLKVPYPLYANKIKFSMTRHNNKEYLLQVKNFLDHNATTTSNYLNSKHQLLNP